MKMITKRWLISILFSICIMPMFAVRAYATDTNTISNTPTQKIGSGSLQTKNPDIKSPAITENSNGDYIIDSNLPNVSMEQVSHWANKKGFDVVGLMQTIVQPIAIVVFIASSLVIMFGVFGRGDMVTKGLFGLAISVIMYTGVLFAPDILLFFSQWLSS